MKIIAQCGRCQKQTELQAEPAGTLRCACGGLMSVYKSSKLSPEELARYGPPLPSKRPVGVVDRPPVKMSSEEQSRRAKMRYTNQDGEPIKPPVIIQDRKREEQKDMSNELKNGQPVKSNAPDKIEVLKEIAAGISVSKLEKKWKMGQGALSYYIYKWGWKGIKPDRAQQLLDEMKIDLPGSAKVLQEKGVAKSDPNVTSPDVAKLQQKVSVLEENTELRKENANRNDESQVVVESLGAAVEARIVAPVSPRTSRQIRIESVGNQNDIEDELLAILAYVQAMRGRDLRLELYLGEVAH